MSETSSQKRETKSWRDFIITPLLEVALLGGSVFAAIKICQKFSIGTFGGTLIFYAFLVLFTLVVLKVVRLFGSIKRGIYSYQTHPWTFYFWQLHGFLCSTNLGLFYVNGLVPPVLRKYFYFLLGSQIGSGLISIGGRFLDPYLIQIGKSVQIGDDALLIPHSYAVGSSDLLVLEKIDIGTGAVIGPRSTIMPGVTLGENAMVKAMSIVSMNTKIPANEIWGGIPAKKVADVDQPIQS